MKNKVTLTRTKRLTIMLLTIIMMLSCKKEEKPRIPFLDNGQMKLNTVYCVDEFNSCNSVLSDILGDDIFVSIASGDYKLTTSDYKITITNQQIDFTSKYVCFKSSSGHRYDPVIIISNLN